MAQTVPIKLSKFDNQPWGFRIQGGKDFSTPITVQKVNGGSLAERAGLNAGDTILSINGIDALKLRHKEAQDTLVKAGNNFEIVVVRGNVWKPAVTPLAEPKIQQNGEQVLTKTSLASSQQAPKHIGSAHNVQPAPFGKKQTPTVNGAPIHVYNSPVGLYSEESIAETLTAQAEVLSQGVLGVNFKKNERQYNAAQSEVLKMIQENDSCPKAPESTEPPVHAMSSRPAGIRPVEYPKPKPKTDDHSGIAPDLTKCGDCDRLIVGVFVKIKDRNLHVECFKCATCGTSLKNVGYYNISGKLYCDIHARQAARHHPEQPEQAVATEASSPVPPSAVQLEKIRPRAQAAAQLQAAAALSREPKTPPVGGVRMFPGVLFEGGAPEKAQPPTPKPRVEVPKPEPPQPEPVPEPVAQPIEEPAAEAVQPEVPEPEPQSSAVAAEPVSQEVEAQPALEPEPEPAPVEQVPETVEPSVEAEPVAVDEPAVVEPEVLEAAPAPAPTPAPAPAPEPVYHPAPSPVPVAAPSVVKAPAFNQVLAPKATGQDRPLSGDYRAFIPRPAGTPFMWPPAKNPEAEPVATATPLYFSPGTRIESMVDVSRSQVVETVVQKSSFESFSSMSKTTVQSSSLNGVTEFKAPELPSLAPVAPLPMFTPLVNQQPPAPIVKSVPAPVAKPASIVSNPVVAAAIQPVTKPITPVAAPSPLPKPVNPPAVAPAAALFSSAPVAPTVSAPSFVAPYMPAPTPAPAVGASGQTTSAPRRGKGVLSHAVAPGVRVPVCSACEKQIRGPFVTALGRNWCPEHFVCANDSCKRHLQEVGFVEEKNELYCESCFENYLAPVCDKCQKRVIGDCLKAIGKQFHPECFACAYCGRLFENSRFYLEDGLPYCEADWNELFTTKCFGCGFPIEAGDRWVEAMNNNYHSQCFNCSVCKKNLEGQSFLAKGGKPMCKSHAARV